MKMVIGIISYFPDDEPSRSQRIERFTQLQDRLIELFPDFPMMVVAQNWKDFVPKHKVIKKSYDRLGILEARKTLRRHFLRSSYTDIITIDDDCIIVGDSAEEYINQIKNNYGGVGVFRWEYSQLNLLYISKDIYKQIDLPNIDPEKDEGFEDTIFTATVKQLFPNNVFTFENTGLDEIGFRYEGENKVPSTWAGVRKRDWKRLRGDTQKVKEQLSQGISLDDALNSINIGSTSKEKVKNKELVDVVITYVDGSDREWQKDFNKYSPKDINEETNSVQRFRSDNRFKYIFRGIELYAPWVGDVYLVVHSDSQVPTWINRKEVKIVYHRDIIPKKHLPVFNSQAIEMFLGNIEGLNERFLYFNDDMYLVGPVTENTFFDEHKVKVSFYMGHYDESEKIPLWKRSIINSNELVNSKEHNILKEQKKYVQPNHGVRAYLLNHIEEVNVKYKKEIDNSITKFRAENNFTTYLYDLDLRAKGLTLPIDHNFKYYAHNTPTGLILNSISNPQAYNIICINDTSDSVDNKREELINNHFAKTFPIKSKYEQ